VRTLIDFADAPIFAIPAIDERTGTHLVREGMLIEGPQGWGEFSPPLDSDDGEAVRWLTAAMEVGTVGWPDAVRGRIPVSVVVPAVDATTARRLVIDSGCATADVVVGEPGGFLADDVARLEAVRDALGASGKIRCEVHGNWDVDTAISAIRVLDKATGGLEYVEQPCGSLDELAAVRRKVDVRIAVDESIRRAANALRDSSRDVQEAADVAVLKCGPLGGVRRALRVAEVCGLTPVVSSTIDTTIGLSAGLALAGALPELPFACGLGTRTLLSDDVVARLRSLVPVHGYLPVAPTPPTPDRELLAKYRPVDPEVIEKWVARLRGLTGTLT
jgi:O-succinylbenzoate synthase